MGGQTVSVIMPRCAYAKGIIQYSRFVCVCVCVCVCIGMSVTRISQRSLKSSAGECIKDTVQQYVEIDQFRCITLCASN